MNREIPCVTPKALFVYVLLKVPFCSMFDSHPFYVLRESDTSRMSFSFYDKQCRLCGRKVANSYFMSPMVCWRWKAYEYTGSREISFKYALSAEFDTQFRFNSLACTWEPQMNTVIESGPTKARLNASNSRIIAPCPDHRRRHNLQINCSEIIIYDASGGRHRKNFRFRLLGRQLVPMRKS